MPRPAHLVPNGVHTCGNGILYIVSGGGGRLGELGTHIIRIYYNYLMIGVNGATYCRVQPDRNERKNEFCAGIKSYMFGVVVIIGKISYMNLKIRASEECADIRILLHFGKFATGFLVK